MKANSQRIGRVSEGVPHFDILLSGCVGPSVWFSAAGWLPLLCEDRARGRDPQPQEVDNESVNTDLI
eukprot:1780787-Amphidinium_carterae.1